jgi:hypothetical protein
MKKENEWGEGGGGQFFTDVNEITQPIKWGRRDFGNH